MPCLAFLRPLAPSLAPTLALLLALSLALALAPALRAEEATPPLPAVTVTAAASADFVQRVPIAGNVVALEEVQVHPEVSGHAVAAPEADIGDVVRTGDVLARLNTRVLKRQLALQASALTRAKAGLEQARSQVAADRATLTQALAPLERAQSLRASGSGTQASLDDAIAARTSAQAAARSGWTRSPRSA